MPCARCHLCFPTTQKLHVGKATILARTFLNPTLFSKPATRDEWLVRVRGNVSHYRSLYLLLAGAVLVYTVLSSPLLLIGLCLLAGAWAYAFVLTSPETPINVFGMELRRREKLIALLPFSLLVVTLCGLITSLVWVCFLSSIIALPHASFHEVRRHTPGTKTRHPDAPAAPAAPRSRRPRRCLRDARPHAPTHATHDAHARGRRARRQRPPTCARARAACGMQVVEMDALDALELEALAAPVPGAI